MPVMDVVSVQDVYELDGAEADFFKFDKVGAGVRLFPTAQAIAEAPPPHNSAPSRNASD